MQEKEKSSAKTKDISYTYWVSKTGPSSVKIPCAPTKIDSAEAEKIETMVRQKSQGSSWNCAGTWEEKKISMETLKAHLNKMFKNYTIPGEKWKITDIKDLSGEVYFLV